MNNFYIDKHGNFLYVHKNDISTEGFEMVQGKWYCFEGDVLFPLDESAEYIKTDTIVEELI